MSAKRRRRKNNNGPLIGTIIILLLVLLVLGGLVWKGGLLGGQTSRSETVSDGETDGFQMHYVGPEDDAADADAEDASVEEGAEGAPAESGEVQLLSGEGVYSENGMMVRLSDGAILFDKASKEKMYPASMTKIMTCILALENISDMNSEITIKQQYIDAYYSEGASRAGFEPGEVVTVKDVLYGIMLPSGAEACLAVCDRVSGSEEQFVELMNQKAQEIGMTNTHFTNAIGMHNEEHYSTCEDFIKLEQYCLKNDTFRELATTKNYTTSQTDVHPSGISLTNTAFIHLTTTNLANGAIFEGGKTGYTSEAGTTLTSFAKYGEEEYMLVTARGFGIEHANIKDAQTLFGRIGTNEVETGEQSEEPAA